MVKRAINKRCVFPLIPSAGHVGMDVGLRGQGKEKTSVVAVNAGSAAGDWVEATKVDTVIEDFM